MLRRLVSRKRNVVVLSAVAALAIAGAAFAYFTTNGFSTQSGSVTSATANAGKWGVQVSPDPSTTQLLPGSGIDVLPFAITNNSAGNEGLTGVTVTLVSAPNPSISSEADVEQMVSGTPTVVAGCQASWFNIDAQAGQQTDSAFAAAHLAYFSSGTATSSTPVDLTKAAQDVASGGIVKGAAALSLSDSNVNQNACENVSPIVLVQAS
jgi:hypothetical protein